MTWVWAGVWKRRSASAEPRNFLRLDGENALTLPSFRHPRACPEGPGSVHAPEHESNRRAEQLTVAGEAPMGPRDKPEGDGMGEGPQTLNRSHGPVTARVMPGEYRFTNMVRPFGAQQTPANSVFDSSASWRMALRAMA